MNNTNTTSTGWNRPTLTKIERCEGKRSAKVRYLLVCLGFIVLALIGAWFFFGGGETVKSPHAKNTKSIREVPSARSAIASAPRAAEAARKPTSVADAFRNLEQVATPKPVKRAARPVDPKDWPKPVFSSSTEQLMSLIFTNELGNMPVPVPPIDESERKNIVAILISKNEIKDDDPEDVIECKRTVDAAKKEMIKFLKEGGDPDEFLAYYAAEQERVYNYRNEAIGQAQELAETDRGLMADFVKAINEKFKEDGILPIEPRDVGLEEEDYHLLETEKESPKNFSTFFRNPIDTQMGNMLS